MGIAIGKIHNAHKECLDRFSRLTNLVNEVNRLDDEDKGVAKCDTPGVDFIDTSSNGVTQRKIC